MSEPEDKAPEPDPEGLFDDAEVVEEKEPEPEPAPKDDEPKSTAVDLPEMPAPRSKKAKDIEDAFRSAVHMAFIGAGQGGGKIAETFYQLGYRRVCAVNTTSQDLDPLALPPVNKLIMGKSKRGAGKDPAEGMKAAKESFEDIIDLLKRSWGEKVEQMLICVGGGGGSGTGSWTTIINAINEYAKISNIEAPVQQHLGLILTLPKRSEGPKVQKNALVALEQALGMVDSGTISTLIIVDNAKIHELFPDEPAKSFWKVANDSFARVFHTLNLLAAQRSEYATFDRADFADVLRSGLIIFGMTSVEKWDGTDDISHAVRQNLKGSLLGDGFLLYKATKSAAIVVAHDDVLTSIPQSRIDYAFHAFTRALGNENLTPHTGIYEGKAPGMRVLSMVGGLSPPDERLAELRKLGK